MHTWKQFDRNVITHSAAHHLMAIDTLMHEHGYARVSDVARLLEITRGSVSISLKPLKAEGLVEQDENRFIRLSERGQRLVDILRARHYIIKKFMTAVLGVGEERAEIDGCKIEHLLSAETSERLTALLRFIDSGAESADRFIEEFHRFNEACLHDAQACPSCQDQCLYDLASQKLQDAVAEK
ncbi:MAG: Transcriptional regulator MntR [Phycisphaerae bacterium]|nr:Transcriptional regulator MntR [Phycisphaerae bacterium]